jgi:hypothetical protein
VFCEKKNMKTKEIIRAKVFIIPNSLYCPDELGFNGGMISDSVAYWSQKIFDRWLYKNHSEEWRKERKAALGWEGMDSKRQKYVELWFHEPTGENDMSNWRDHGIDGYKELDGWNLLTNYIPAAIFEGYKDGDTVTFDLPIVRGKCLSIDDEDEILIITWIKVAVILDQKNGRYPYNGLFHEILEAKGAWIPTMIPSYSDCKQKILDLQDRIQNHC